MNATIFATYGKTLEHLDKEKALSHWWAGCVAGVAQTCIISPVELIKETFSPIFSFFILYATVSHKRFSSRL